MARQWFAGRWLDAKGLARRCLGWIDAARLARQWSVGGWSGRGWSARGWSARGWSARGWSARGWGACSGVAAGGDAGGMAWAGGVRARDGWSRGEWIDRCAPRARWSAGIDDKDDAGP